MMLVCECGQHNAATREFCQACNAYLEFSAKPLTTAPPAASVSVPVTSAGAKGTPSVADRSVSDPAPTPAMTPSVHASATDGRAFPDRPVTEAWRRCPSCSENNEQSRTFCKSCGTTLPTVEPKSSAPPAPAVSGGGLGGFVRSRVGLGILAVLTVGAAVVLVPIVRDLFSQDNLFETRTPVDVLALDASAAPPDGVCGVSLAGGASPEDALIDGAAYTFWSSSAPQPLVRFEMFVDNSAGNAAGLVVHTADVALLESREFQVYEVDTPKFTSVEVTFVDAGAGDDLLFTPLAVAEVEFFD